MFGASGARASMQRSGRTAVDWLMAEVVSLEIIEQRSDYRFRNPALLTQALIHASVADARVADAVRLGKGMGDRTLRPVSLLAALFESIIGAIYLDAGMDPARAFIIRCLNDRIDESARLGHQQNFKSVLQQSLQRKSLGSPIYIVLHETGPDHAKNFEICVELGARRFPGCWSLSKKSAEQLAALEALVELGMVERGECGEVRMIDAA